MKKFLKITISILLAGALFVTSLPGLAVPVLADEASIEAYSETAKPDPGNLSSEKIVGTFVATRETCEIPFVYQDSYFNGPSTTYNPSLATMSCALAMSAFSYMDESANACYDVGYKNLERVLTDIGYEDFEANDYYKQYPESDSMGVGIATKYIELSDGTIQPIIAVGFRGGNYAKEWGGNVKLGETGEAQGFAAARDVAIQYIAGYMNRHESKLKSAKYGVRNRSPKMWLVGYSRASAAATLTGSAINCAILGEGTYEAGSGMDWLARYINILGVKQEDVYVYGFEVPRASTIYDSSLRASNNGNIWNHLDTMDLVPNVAPYAMEFYHVGSDVKINEGVSQDDFIYQMNQISPAMATKWLGLKQRQPLKTGNIGLKGLLDLTISDEGWMHTVTDAEQKKIGVDFSDYVYRLVNDFLYGAMEGVQKSYYKDLTVRQVYARYYQPTISTIARTLMGATEQERATVMRIVKEKYNDNVGWWTKTELLSKVPGAYGLNPMTLFDIEVIVASKLKDILKDCAKDPEFTAIIPKEEINQMIDANWNLARLLTQVLVNGYHNDMGYITSFIYYMSELFEPHYPQYVLAYLRTKDPNYTNQPIGLYQLTMEKTEGDNPEDMKVSIYIEKTSGDRAKTKVAEVNGKQMTLLSENDLYRQGSVSVHDGKLIISYRDPNMRGGAEEYVVRFEIENSDDKTLETLKISYNYLSEGDDDKAVTQDFENNWISMNSKDLIEIVAKTDNKKEAEFKKVLQMTPKFVDENLKEITGGTVTVKTKDGTETDFANLFIPDGELGEYQFTVRPPSGYYFEDIGLPPFGETIEEIAPPETWYTHLSSQDNPTEWSYDVCSSDIYFICYSKKREGVVYAECIQQTTSAGTVTESHFDGVPITIINETNGSRTIPGTTAQTLDVQPGDKVSIRYDGSAYSGRREFIMWEIEYGEPNDFKINGDTVTFTMPKGGISVKAVFGDPKNAKVRLTFTGSWASNILPQNMTCMWNQIYVDSQGRTTFNQNDSYNYPVKHVFEKISYSARGAATIKAPSYPSSQMGDMVFDHWEVYYSDTGDSCNEEIAIVPDPDAGRYRSKMVNPNGLTDEIIQLNNFDKSLTVVPHYKPATYTLTYKLSDHNSYQKQLEAGETISLYDNNIERGYETASWSSYYYPVTETVDQYGNVIRTASETPKKLEEYYGGGYYRFTMPRGDAVVTATPAPREYYVGLGAYLGTNMNQTRFRYKETVTVYPKNLPAGQDLIGIKVTGLTDSDTIPAEALKNVDGEIYGFEFTMPYENVSVEAVLSATAALSTLTVVGGTAEEEVISTGTAGVYQAYKNDLVCLKANDAPEGTYFSHWEVTPENALWLDSDTDKVAFGIMGDQNVSVEAKYKAATEITSVDLDFTSAFANTWVLPETAFVNSSVQGVVEEQVYLDWFKVPSTVGGEEIWSYGTIIVGWPYNPSFKLNAENGYCFTDDTVVTLHGKTCEVKLAKDGSLDVICRELRTDPSYVTELKAPADLIVPSGTKLADIEKKLSETMAYITIDDGLERGYVDIDWDKKDGEMKFVDENGNPFVYDDTDTDAQEFYVNGNLNLSNFVGSPMTYLDGYLLYRSPLTSAVRLKVQVMASDKICTPYVENYQPGIFREDIGVRLASNTPGAAIIYYMEKVEGETPKELTLEELIAEGEIYNDEQPIALTGSEGENIRYRITAATQNPARSVENGYSEMVVLDYQIQIPVSHQLTVVNGSGSGSYPYDPGKTHKIGIYANSVPGTSFTGFTVDTRNVDFLQDYAAEDAKSIYMPDGDVQITAHYSIDEVCLSIQEPVAGQAFDTTVSKVNQCPDAVKILDMQFVDEAGNPAGETADPTKTYTAKVTLGLNADIPGFSYNTAKLKVQINGQEAEVTQNGDGTFTAAFTCPKYARFFTLKVNNGKAYDPDTGLELTEKEGGYQILEGSKVVVDANPKEGMRFGSWTSNHAAVQPTGRYAEFIMPSADVELTANHNQVIRNVDLTMDNLVAQKNLPTSAALDDDDKGKANLVGVSWYSDDADVNLPVSAGAAYTTTIKLQAKDGYVFADGMPVTLNGEKCMVVPDPDGKTAIAGMAYAVPKQSNAPTPTPTPPGPEEGGDTVWTGDSANPILWIILCVAAAAGIAGCVIVICRKKKRR